MKSIAWLILLASELMLAGCSDNFMGRAPRGSETDRNAPELMAQYGCPACHIIPRVPGAVGQVGPSLAGLGQRSYIAGTLPNTPDNVVSWIMHPQHFRPGTAMPEMGVTQQDARRIQRYLESAR
jgi:cytochrome c2